MGAFKAPGLRNTANTAPYMHNGIFPDLDAVIRHYNHAPPAFPGHSDLVPLALTVEQSEALKAFLQTLSAPPDAPPELLRAPGEGSKGQCRLGGAAGHLFAAQAGEQIVDGAAGHEKTGLIGSAAKMGQDDAVVEPQEGMVARQGFRIGDVHDGAGDLVLPERVDQRVVVDNAAAGDVDQVGGLFHAGKFGGPNKVTGLGRHRQAEDDEICLFQQGIEGAVGGVEVAACGLGLRLW